MALSEPNRRTARTAVQVLIALIPALPIILPALGVAETTAAYALITGIAAVIARVMNADEQAQAPEDGGAV